MREREKGAVGIAGHRRVEVQLSNAAYGQHLVALEGGSDRYFDTT